MVEFIGVSKTYADKFRALKKIDLTIKDGEFVFVVGASGAGKSTFLKLIMREEIPTEGNIYINGYDLNRMRKRTIPYFRRTMGIIFQDFRLIPDANVYDNVAFALRVTGLREPEVRKRTMHALGMVGLLEKQRSLPNELSGGEQQRVAIARALSNDAGLIIADEPTGNVDPQMSIDILELLDHINREHGTTVIMVTHAHELVRMYEHRIVMLKDGEIVADGYDRDAILPKVSNDIDDSKFGYFSDPTERADVIDFIFKYGDGLEAAAEAEKEAAEGAPPESGQDGEEGGGTENAAPEAAADDTEGLYSGQFSFDADAEPVVYDEPYPEEPYQEGPADEVEGGGGDE